MQPVGSRAVVLCAATLFAAIWTMSASAATQCLEIELIPSEPQSAAAGPTARDEVGRIVSAVTIAGEGPFRFLVDTGANRSAVTPHLAQRLKLMPVATAEVHSIHDTVIAPTVRVDTLAYGGVTLTSGLLPVIEGPVLADLDGLLGADALRGRLFLLDFERQCLAILPASHKWRLRGWERVPGEFRFGHLIVMPGRIGDVRANVIVDTGSNATLANVALREQLRLARRPSSKPPTGRGYTAGEPIVIETGILIPSVRLGGLSANNVVAYIGDFHIFDLLGLQSEPTMLVGMDVLSQSSALAIDYERGVVYLRTRKPPDPSIKVRVVR
jgi:predicted aspartyl protease